MKEKKCAGHKWPKDKPIRVSSKNRHKNLYSLFAEKMSGTILGADPNPMLRVSLDNMWHKRQWRSAIVVVTIPMAQYMLFHFLTQDLASTSWFKDIRHDLVSL